MKAIVIPTSLNDKPFLIDIGENELDTYHKYIGCGCLDFVTLYYDYCSKRAIECVIDDAGLQNGSPVNEYWKRACNEGHGTYQLAGKTIITMVDRLTGDTCELDLDFIKSVLNELYTFTDEDLKDIA